MRVRVTRIQGEIHRGCRGSVLPPSTAFAWLPAASLSSIRSTDTRNSCQSAQFLFRVPRTFYAALEIFRFDRACAGHACARSRSKKRPRLTKISFRSVTCERAQPPPRAWRVCARNKCLARSNRTETIRRQRNDRMFSLIPCRVTRI